MTCEPVKLRLATPILVVLAPLGSVACSKKKSPLTTLEPPIVSVVL
jgi:hypothetical protein